VGASDEIRIVQKFSEMNPQPPSFDDHLAALDSTPLFMKSLPVEDADDIAVSALQSLAYEGTPDGE
jgi:hypothetical protein